MIDAVAQIAAMAGENAIFKLEEFAWILYLYEFSGTQICITKDTDLKSI